MTLPNLIPAVAAVAERYITLKGVHPNKTYNYAARRFYGLPVFQSELHSEKCKIGESWLYLAVPAEADLKTLSRQDRLYIGAQTQDRMFRGDGMGGQNFHHAEMRAGNVNDTPLEFLRSGRSVVIYRAHADSVAAIIQADPKFEPLRPIVQQPRTTKRHLGWWLEQFVLHAERDQWRWNTAPADRALVSLFGR